MADIQACEYVRKLSRRVAEKSTEHKKKKPNGRKLRKNSVSLFTVSMAAPNEQPTRFTATATGKLYCVGLGHHVEKPAQGRKVEAGKVKGPR